MKRAQEIMEDLPPHLQVWMKYFTMQIQQPPNFFTETSVFSSQAFVFDSPNFDLIDVCQYLDASPEDEFLEDSLISKFDLPSKLTYKHYMFFRKTYPISDLSESSTNYLFVCTFRLFIAYVATLQDSLKIPDKRIQILAHANPMINFFSNFTGERFEDFKVILFRMLGQVNYYWNTFFQLQNSHMITALLSIVEALIYIADRTEYAADCLAYWASNITEFDNHLIKLLTQIFKLIKPKLGNIHNAQTLIDGIQIIHRKILTSTCNHGEEVYQIGLICSDIGDLYRPELSVDFFIWCFGEYATGEPDFSLKYPINNHLSALLLRNNIGTQTALLPSLKNCDLSQVQVNTCIKFVLDQNPVAHFEDFTIFLRCDDPGILEDVNNLLIYNFQKEKRLLLCQLSKARLQYFMKLLNYMIKALGDTLIKNFADFGVLNQLNLQSDESDIVYDYFLGLLPKLNGCYPPIIQFIHKNYLKTERMPTIIKAIESIINKVTMIDIISALLSADPQTEEIVHIFGLINPNLPTDAKIRIKEKFILDLVAKIGLLFPSTFSSVISVISGMLQSSMFFASDSIYTLINECIKIPDKSQYKTQDFLKLAISDNVIWWDKGMKLLLNRLVTDDENENDVIKKIIDISKIPPNSYQVCSADGYDIVCGRLIDIQNNKEKRKLYFKLLETLCSTNLNITDLYRIIKLLKSEEFLYSYDVFKILNKIMDKKRDFTIPRTQISFNHYSHGITGIQSVIPQSIETTICLNEKSASFKNFINFGEKFSLIFKSSQLYISQDQKFEFEFPLNQWVPIEIRFENNNIKLNVNGKIEKLKIKEYLPSESVSIDICRDLVADFSPITFLYAKDSALVIGEPNIPGVEYNCHFLPYISFPQDTLPTIGSLTNILPLLGLLTTKSSDKSKLLETLLDLIKKILLASETLQTTFMSIRGFEVLAGFLSQIDSSYFTENALQVLLDLFTSLNDKTMAEQMVIHVWLDLDISAKFSHSIKDTFFHTTITHALTSNEQAFKSVSMFDEVLYSASIMYHEDNEISMAVWNFLSLYVTTVKSKNAINSLLLILYLKKNKFVAQRALKILHQQNETINIRVLKGIFLFKDSHLIKLARKVFPSSLSDHFKDNITDEQAEEYENYLINSRDYEESAKIETMLEELHERSEEHFINQRTIREKIIIAFMNDLKIGTGPWSMPVEGIKYRISNSVSNSGRHIMLAINHNFDVHQWASYDRNNRTEENQIRCLHFKPVKIFNSTEPNKFVTNVKLIRVHTQWEGTLTLYQNHIAFEGRANVKSRRLIIKITDIGFIFDHMFNRQQIGAEIHTYHRKSYLFQFAPKQREIFYSLLPQPSTFTDKKFHFYHTLQKINKSLHQTMDPSSLMHKLPITQMWVKNEISNYQYLYCINLISGRSYHDNTQYIVFPLVLTDNATTELNLTDKANYRDLSYPVAALNPAHRKGLEKNYKDYQVMINTGPIAEPAVHYYLIRTEPYTTNHLDFQKRFDVPDRLFREFDQIYRNHYSEIMSNKFELAPELFSFPQALVNENGFDLGVESLTNTRVNDVILPKWSGKNPVHFIAGHNAALENKLVSSKLHHWIDLMFGVHREDAKHYNVYRSSLYPEKKPSDEDIAMADFEMATCGSVPTQVFALKHPSQETIKLKPIQIQFSIDKTLIEMKNTSIITESGVFMLNHRNTYKLFDLKQNGKILCMSRRMKLIVLQQKSDLLSIISLKKKSIIKEIKHDKSLITCATVIGGTYLLTCGNDCSVNVWDLSSDDFQLISSSSHQSDYVIAIGGSSDIGIIVSINKNYEVVLQTLFDHIFIKSFTLKQPSVPNHKPQIIVFKSGIIAIAFANDLTTYDLQGNVIHHVQLLLTISNVRKYYDTDYREFIILQNSRSEIMIYDAATLERMTTIKIDDLRSFGVINKMRMIIAVTTSNVKSLSFNDYINSVIAS